MLADVLPNFIKLFFIFCFSAKLQKYREDNTRSKRP